MNISVSNPVFSTYVFITIFLCILLFSYKKNTEKGLSVVKSQELKGFAIFGVLFAHIGYFLSNQHNFLFPISIAAGVAVNLFLFLSGFGLTISSLSKKETILQFYKRRIGTLLIPFWITLFFYIILDFFVLHILYSKQFILQSFFGIFPHAHIFNDLNSPLWYMTWILFYYLLFPLFFIRKKPWVSALILYLVSWGIVYIEPKFFSSVIGLYKVHIYAFPLGILSAYVLSKKESVDFFEKILNTLSKIKLKFLIQSILLFLIGYFLLNSGVGQSIEIEQRISIYTMILVIIFFISKKSIFRLLTLFGVYSYEIYLIHWPLMYRYDFLYKIFPAYLATLLYVPLLLLLAWILRYVSGKIVKICRI